jgi:hypothetical protein
VYTTTGCPSKSINCSPVSPAKLFAADVARLTLVVLPPDHGAADKATRSFVDAATKEHGSSARTFKSGLVWAGIKECQLDLYADRTSTATMRANQLRLWFASMAYVLLCALRRIGLHHTQCAKATCGPIRLNLLKIAALIRVSVRRIKVAMASGCPAADAWASFSTAHILPCAHPPVDAPWLWYSINATTR